MYYIYTDHLQTARAITDTSNNLVWTWENKEVFGNNLTNETISGSTFKFNFRFPGQYFDSETNLNYNIHRDYNPVWGRYIESDPLGLVAGINTYGYVGGNSLGFSDRKGLFIKNIIGAFVGAVVNGYVNGMNYKSLGCSTFQGIINGAIGGLLGGAVFPNNPFVGGAIIGSITETFNMRQGIQSLPNPELSLVWAALSSGATSWLGGLGGEDIAAKYARPILGEVLGNVNRSAYGMQINNWIIVGGIVKNDIPECGCKTK